ncbi:hypothetical protein C8A00DRAFT_29771 [Chaetomidium leptoderma]|uniref:Uncharacterized protein n=1 Tax=Chaetomidium leptoderma TaxID=669021 RepID=A0AAN7A0V4_9PEZI|nr:hypothetical protein C8A00DRAFT_29771 [Chaetomidium leptoderma]
MKHASSLLLAAGLAAAQSTSVVTILMPMADPQSIEASVVSAGPTATSYHITCPTGFSPGDCGLGDGIDLLYGPSTMAYTMTFPGEGAAETAMASCKLDAAKQIADCSAVLILGTSTSTVAESLTSYSSFMLPVTITAGLEKLSGVTSSAPTGASTTSSTAPVPTDAASSGTPPDPASSSSTGGMPRVTQNAAIVGAAALVGAMLI